LVTTHSEEQPKNELTTTNVGMKFFGSVIRNISGVSLGPGCCRIHVVCMSTRKQMLASVGVSAIQYRPKHSTQERKHWRSAVGIIIHQNLFQSNVTEIYLRVNI